MRIFCNNADFFPFFNIISDGGNILKDNIILSSPKGGNRPLQKNLLAKGTKKPDLKKEKPKKEKNFPIIQKVKKQEKNPFFKNLKNNITSTQKKEVKNLSVQGVKKLQEKIPVRKADGSNSNKKGKKN